MITIILIISAVALPFVIPALSHRQVSEGARILQGSLVGARDQALKDGTPSGIRLLPDPAFPLVYLPNGQIDTTQPLAANRIVPIQSAPKYTEAAITKWEGPLQAAVASLAYSGPASAAYPNPTYGQTGCLMVSESILDQNNQLQNPTSWFWNIRIGDKIQINNSGPWYTVIGPMIVGPSGLPAIASCSSTLARPGRSPRFSIRVDRVDSPNSCCW